MKKKAKKKSWQGKPKGARRKPTTKAKGRTLSLSKREGSYDPRNPLKNTRRESFCMEYLVDLNATQAAIRAGYSEKGANVRGSELLANRNIQLRIAYLVSQRNERIELSQDWVVQRLKDVAERCMQREPILDKEGNPTGEYRFDSTGANKALDCLMKHLGGYQKDNGQKQPAPPEIHVTIVGGADVPQ